MCGSGDVATGKRRLKFADAKCVGTCEDDGTGAMISRVY